MIPPEFPKNEAERLSEIKKYNLVDTPPEQDFDNITNLVASICEVPISLISIIEGERNFFKSHHGVPLNEAKRSTSLCGHAILEESEIFIVKDATLDKRFCDNPTLQEFNVVFYAGVPLINPHGYALGTLCIYDSKPRELNDKQKEALISLANQVVNIFELRKMNTQLQAAQRELQQRNERLNAFANVVSHDLKSPLANITSLTRLLREETFEILNEDSKQYLEYIEESSTTLKGYIDGILRYYRTDALLEQKRQDIELVDFFNEVKEMLIVKDNRFIYPTQGTLKNINKAALTQIVLNLVDNALKYNNKTTCTVTVNFIEEELYYKFVVTDDGRGIEKEKQSEIFELFNTGGIKDSRGREGTGIGLTTVKTLVNKLGGEIWLDSTLGEGSTFTFTIKK